MNLDGRFTWNGEKIRTSFDYPPIPIRQCDWSAVLDGYDPTEWDYDTPAHGPHATIGFGHSEGQAIADLIEQLSEL